MASIIDMAKKELRGFKVRQPGEKPEADSPSIIEMAKREMRGFKVKQPKSNSPDIPGQRSLNKKGPDVEDKASDKVEEKAKPKVKAKPTVKKLKDTSSEYWSADGISGDYGSATGETGPDMGQVNKGGYDPEAEGMKRGGKVKKMAKGGSASSRGDGCAQRGKTRGRFV